MTTALHGLEEAARALEVARLKCDEALVARGGVDHRDRHALGAIGGDIVDAALFFLPDAVERVIQASNRKIEDLQAGRVSAVISELGGGVKAARVPAEGVRGEAAHFRLAIKLIYFLIRSFQDAVYRVSYQVLEGEKPKKEQSASMKWALRNGDPVGRMLGQFVAEYEPWFSGWRAIRDRIKIGQGAGILGAFEPGSPFDDIGINLNLVTADGGIEINLSKGTRVSDVTEAILMSTKLVEVLTEAAV